MIGNSERQQNRVFLNGNRSKKRHPNLQRRLRSISWRRHPFKRRPYGAHGSRHLSQQKRVPKTEADRLLENNRNHLKNGTPKKSWSWLPKTLKSTLKNRTVKVQAWIYEHKSPIGGIVPILFLDTDVEGNEAQTEQ